MHFSTVYSDSKSYIALSRFFLGEGQVLSSFIATRALLPLLVSPLVPLLGFPISYGLVNTILWVGSAVIVYELTLRLFNSERASLLASLPL